MSYNIDNWKTKQLKNFTIPLKAFYRHERTDWHPKQPEIINPETSEIRLECGCEQEIKGTLRDGILTVSEFDMSGEGSGTFYHLILEPALHESSGELEAVLVWEGGDSITRLKVSNGEVEVEDVDL